MLHKGFDIAFGAILGVCVRFLFRQLMVVQADFFLGPLVKQFWSHAFRHEEKSPLNCNDCADNLYSLPN